MRLPDNWSFRAGCGRARGVAHGVFEPLPGGAARTGAARSGARRRQRRRHRGDPARTGPGATAFATAGSAAKLDACRRLGAAGAIDYKNQDFVAEIKNSTGGRGVDLVLDPVGAAYLKRNLDVLAPGGPAGEHRADGRLAGGTGPGGAARQGAALVGSRLRPRSLPEKVDIVRRFTERFLPLLAAGKLQPVIDRVFPDHRGGDRSPAREGEPQYRQGRAEDPVMLPGRLSAAAGSRRG